MQPKVLIEASDDVVTVTVRNPKHGAHVKTYETPGMLTGADLAEVLDLLGVSNEYTYLEG